MCSLQVWLLQNHYVVDIIKFEISKLYFKDAAIFTKQ